MNPPTAKEFAALTRRTASDVYELDVYLADGRLVDVHVDGESVFPTWFKLEFKENGEVSAKVKGIRLSSRAGDLIRIHQGETAPTSS